MRGWIDVAGLLSAEEIESAVVNRYGADKKLLKGDEKLIEHVEGVIRDAVDRFGQDLVGPPPLARLGERVAQVEQRADPVQGGP